jgi:hypothetical protein
MVAGKIYYTKNASGIYPSITCSDGTLTYVYYLNTIVNPPPPTSGEGRFVYVIELDANTGDGYMTDGFPKIAVA